MAPRRVSHSSVDRSAREAAGPAGQSRTKDVRAALARTDFHAGLTEPVIVHETPLSWVFLAADRAYKLRKPLALASLDQSTPERRHALCHEEVRLNRRLAPEVYLGLRAITETAAGFELASDDDPHAVDYVVEMRRYDERRTLSRRLERGELRRDEVREVGGVLARLHARAPCVASIGVPALAVERRMAASFHELLAVVEQRAEIERVLALERFAHAFVVAHARSLNARARLGRIREGYGDLRAEHVLVDGGVQLVGCVELDRRLRERDVADDLASLVMDLVARGGERYARALVRGYRDDGGHPGDDALIAFYAAYCALVRAKVALLRAAEEPLGSAVHGHHSARARDLLCLAERFAWQARLPLAIVVCGVPRSGKTSLAEALASVSGLAHLDSELTRRRLAGLTPSRRARDDAHEVDLDALAAAELGRRAARRVAARGGVIVDAAFGHRAERDAFASAFADAAPLLFVECCAPAAVLVRRAAKPHGRVMDVSTPSVRDVTRERSSWEPLDEVAPQAHLTLRTDRCVEDLTADLLGSLDQRLGRGGV
jgi:aminoglycoside phosphotransferase family enzyme/predicted kinase